MNSSKKFSLIKKSFNEKEIISLYVYGSLVAGSYAEGRSDVDILLICEIPECNQDFLERLEASKKLIPFRTDVNVIYKHEFEKRRYIYRSAVFLVGIKKNNILLRGEDLLSTVEDSEFNFESLYERSIDLATSSRGVYLNSKQEDFWRPKFLNWLRIFCLEVLFLEGVYEPDFKKALKILVNNDQKLDFIRKLDNNKPSMKILVEVAACLEFYIYDRYRKNKQFITKSCYQAQLSSKSLKGVILETKRNLKE